MRADEYDRWYETGRGQWISRLEYAMVLDALAIRPNHTLLDVGCGTGWFTRKFSDDPRLHVTGLDTDRKRLAFARLKDDRPSYVQADAQRLPFSDNAFDGVVSITALTFVADWRQAIAEIVRVSRGRFVLGLLNRNSLLWREKGQGGGVGAYSGAHWHTAREISSALRGMSVTDVSMRSCVFLPSGGPVARFVETLVPATILHGAFLVVAGRKSTQSRLATHRVSGAG